ncbi:hypothetical protein PMAYCL1PPCAC_29222, partial [Pristionchus mayeri]
RLMESGRLERRMRRRRSRSPSRSRSRSRSRSPRRRVKRERRSPEVKREMDLDHVGNEGLPKDIEIFESFAEKNSSLKRIMNKFDWDYDDANMWMETMKELEKEGATMDVMRAAFSEVLDRWPYCYGYWCKWATIEAKIDALKAFEVFEYAVNTFPLSVDLWLAYIRFMRTELMKRSDGLEGIQRLNARALMTVGKEWRSLPVWKEVIAFETSIGNPLAVTIVLDNMISTPMEGMADAWELVMNHFERTPLKDLLKPMERNEVESECLKNVTNIDEEGCKMRALDRRHSIYEETRRRANEMTVFESKVKRHYFHWKPLERGQLINWKKYLEWMCDHSEGREEDCILTFERALIPCALYDEFWLMYAEYRESRGELEMAKGILERAHRVHCKRSVNIAISLASLLETMDLDFEATEALLKYDMNYPGNLLIYNRYLSIIKRREARCGGECVHEKGVAETYECLIRNAVLPYANHNIRYISHKVKENDRLNISSYYSMRYSRYLRKVKGQSKMAMKVLKTAISNDPTNETLYHALIDLHYEKYPLDIQSIKESFDLCLKSSMTPLGVKVRMSQCKIELFEEIGTCPREMREFTSSHRELMASRGEKEL